MTIVEKRGLLAPRTSVDSFVAKDGTLYILSSSGGNLDFFTANDLFLQTKTWTIEVFKTHTIHGIHSKTLRKVPTSSMDSSDKVEINNDRMEMGIIIVYGDKSVCILKQQGFEIYCTLQLSDLVLDCRVMSRPCSSPFVPSNYILVGTAHNFIDIFDYCNGQRHLQRLQHSVCACLFSLVIAWQPTLEESSSSLSLKDSIHVASGTAFGKIMLWNLHNVGINRNSSLDKKDGLYGVQGSITHGQTLIGHEGVIFRVAFSMDCSRVASVSDDRTVRVWDSQQGTQIFVGWGHVCRVWDVIFYRTTYINDDESGGDMIITSGEDCTIKLWNYSRNEEAFATLRGHDGKSCWRIHALPIVPSSSSIVVDSSRYIVSTGNDASIKVWDMLVRRQVSTNDPLGAPISLPIPFWNDIGGSDRLGMGNSSDSVTSDTRQHANEGRRSKTIIMVRGHPSGSHWLVVTINGCIYRVNKTSNDSRELKVDAIEVQKWRWCQVVQIEKHISTVDAIFEDVDEYVIVGHPDGYISVVELKWQSMEKFESKQYEWKAHEMRAVRIWLVRVNGQLCALAAIAKGMCSFWLLTQSQTPTLLFTCTTAKGDIATALHITMTKRVIIGDSRGSLSFYAPSFVPLPEDGTFTNKDHLLPAYHFKCHSPEPVSQVGGHINSVHRNEEEIIVSLGHDAHFNTYRWHHESGQYILTTRSSTLPITTPDFFQFYGSASTLSTYIGGYQSSTYYLLDLHCGYELLRVDAGGWKRPHFCQLIDATTSSSCIASEISIPFVTFALFTPEKIVNGISKVSTLDIIQNRDNFPQKDYNYHQIKAGHLGTYAHGKITYCGTIVKLPNYEKLLLIGGEEGNLRSYLVSPFLDNLSFQQILEFPFNRPVRCVAGCDDISSGRGIVVAAGSKLHYAIYAYDTEGFRQYIESIDTSGYALNSFFATVCTGSTWSEATQDHRILTLSICCTTNATFHIILCDSRGIVSLIIFDLDSSDDKVKTLENFKGSEHPLISSDMHILKYQDGHSVLKRKCEENENRNVREHSKPDQLLPIVFCALGDTAGLVSVWLLKGSRSMPEAALDIPFLRNSMCLFSYQAHSMGANTTHIVDMEENMYEHPVKSILVFSGGDDQSICACIFHVKSESNAALGIDLPFSIEMLQCYRFDGCMGSAIKGVHFVHGFLIAVGYDQRLSLWKVEIDSTLWKQDNTRVIKDAYTTCEVIRVARENQWGKKTVPSQVHTTLLSSLTASTAERSINLSWLEGSIVQIGDVNALHVDVDDHSDGSSEVNAVTIGEGCQLFKLKLGLR